MAATLTGTPEVVTWASGSNPAGQSITIPGDATAVYMFWTWWRNATGEGLASVTLGGASPDETFELPTNVSPAFDAVATGVAAWYNPSTGTQTLDPAWDGTPADGPTTIVAYVTGGDTTGWRDADADHDTSSTAVTVTLTTVAGDLVIKYDQRYSASTPPNLSTGWSSGQTDSNNNESVRLSYISATGTTQVCNSENEEYSSIVAISIPTAAGGAATVSGSGAIAGIIAIVSASGNLGRSGAGSLDGYVPTLAATGERIITGSSDLDGYISEVSGTLERIIAATGSPQGYVPTISGTGERTIVAVGSTAAVLATIDATGELIHTGSGAIDATVITISGTGERVIVATGSVDGYIPTIVGTSGVTGSADFVAAIAEIAGTGERVITATGAISGTTITLSGIAERTIVATGSADSPVVTITGTGNLAGVGDFVVPIGIFTSMNDDAIGKSVTVQGL